MFNYHCKADHLPSNNILTLIGKLTINCFMSKIVTHQRKEIR